MLNLDTHILIFAVNGDLRPAERELLSSNRWSVSSIVLWELAKLVQLGRIGMNLDSRDVRNVLARLHVWPIDRKLPRLQSALTSEETRRMKSLVRQASYMISRFLPEIVQCAGRTSSHWQFQSDAYRKSNEALSNGIRSIRNCTGRGSTRSNLR